MMTMNIGNWDRWLRVALGLFVTSLVFWGPRMPWAWLGLVVSITGLVGNCPLYTALRISTCSSEKHNPKSPGR